MKCEICAKDIIRVGRQKYCKNCAKKVQAQQTKAWKLDHHEQTCAHSKKWNQANPEKRAEISRNYKKTHREAYNYSAKYYMANHRSGIRLDIWNEQDHKCNYCKKSIDGYDICQDHIIPLSKGGSNDRSNLQVLCRKCNSSKRDKCD